MRQPGTARLGGFFAAPGFPWERNGTIIAIPFLRESGRLIWPPQNMVPSTPAGSGAKVLVVDDHPDTADLVARLLETAGYAIMQADSAYQAVEHLDGNCDISLILSDIRMPNVDGFDFLRLVRQRYPSLPMVLMTGLPITQEDFVPRGARILQKPFGISELQRVVAEALAPPCPDAEGR